MEHNIDKLKKNVEGRGWSFKCFASGAEAADYLAGELASSSVGIGGCTTADSIGLYEKLTPSARKSSGTGKLMTTPQRGAVHPSPKRMSAARTR